MASQDETESPTSAPDMETMETSSTTFANMSTSDPADVNVEPSNNDDDDDNNNNNNNCNQKSALRENIERKGKNSYYFAHAHKASGPAWDGKAEPKLLSRQASASVEAGNESANRVQNATTTSSFEYYKSNITTYAFLDEGMKVKLYIDMEGVGEACVDEDCKLDFTTSSLCLVVTNYKQEPLCLSFGKLTANISAATLRKKKDKIILTLTKVEEGEWHTINDKGSPDHEVV
jgi:hypothetical protein